MIERLRALIDRPVDPEVAKALLAFAVAVGVGFAIVFALAGLGHGARTDRATVRSSTADLTRGGGRPAPAPFRWPAQDPQDRPGSPAHRRAAAELAAHRALQHVPFTLGSASIDLVGARGGRALLRVEAPSVATGHRAWQAFLRRYHDHGDAYVPIFEGDPRRRGS